MYLIFSAVPLDFLNLWLLQVISPSVDAVRIAVMENGDSAVSSFVGSTIDTAYAAVAFALNSPEPLCARSDASGIDAWPITGLSYAIMRTTTVRACVARCFL